LARAGVTAPSLPEGRFDSLPALTKFTMRDAPALLSVSIKVSVLKESGKRTVKRATSVGKYVTKVRSKLR
jgi:hypothetical protein